MEVVEMQEALRAIQELVVVVVVVVQAVPQRMVEMAAMPVA